mmetsp:Transcript_665/g.1315  ORF Transcript_665/g.1315 Transcript_665/m.1315 type:complete len:335 (-) Transcript_665:515-1519(-)
MPSTSRRSSGIRSLRPTWRAGVPTSTSPPLRRASPVRVKRTAPCRRVTRRPSRRWPSGRTSTSCSPSPWRPRSLRCTTSRRGCCASCSVGPTRPGSGLACVGRSTSCSAATPGWPSPSCCHSCTRSPLAASTPVAGAPALWGSRRTSSGTRTPARWSSRAGRWCCLTRASAASMSSTRCPTRRSRCCTRSWSSRLCPLRRPASSPPSMPGPPSWRLRTRWTANGTGTCPSWRTSSWSPPSSHGSTSSTSSSTGWTSKWTPTLPSTSFGCTRPTMTTWTNRTRRLQWRPRGGPVGSTRSPSGRRRSSPWSSSPSTSPTPGGASTPPSPRTPAATW